jgi:hypothetical protein
MLIDELKNDMETANPKLSTISVSKKVYRNLLAVAEAAYDVVYEGEMELRLEIALRNLENLN